MQSYARRTLPAVFKTFRKAALAADDNDGIVGLALAAVNLPSPADSHCADSCTLRNLCRHAMLDLLPAAVECVSDLQQRTRSCVVMPKDRLCCLHFFAMQMARHAWLCPALDDTDATNLCMGTGSKKKWTITKG